jgi:putative aldouronate transport system substrate-binding protein
MKRTLRITALVLSLALLFTVALACNNQGQTTTTKTPGQTTTGSTAGTTTATTAAPGLFDEKLTITWMVYNQFDNPVPEGSVNQKLIEEMFNVELIIPQLDVHNQEQWTVYWASGNTADRIQSNNMNNFFHRFAEQGLIRPISEDMLYTYAPNFMELVEALVPKDLVIPQITFNDEVWLMPYTNIAQAKQVWVTAARKSWMDRVGITSAPATLADMENMITKFAKEDPDGNGKDDTYGIHLYGYTGAGYLWGTLGVFPNSYYDVNGQIIRSNTTEAYKQGLKILQSWHNDGLLDPEFITDDRTIQRVKWTEGIIGLLNDHPWWFASSTPNNLSAMITNTYEGDELVYFPAVKGPDGKSGSNIGFPQVINNGVYFGADTSDAVVQRIMAIQDAMAADMELYFELYYGKKGETYELDEDGIIRPFSDILTKEKISELGVMQTFALIPTGPDHFNRTTPKADMPTYEASLASPPLFAGRAFPVNGVNTALDEKGADVNRVIDEYYFNAVSGKIDIDATWDAYIAELNSVGLQAILDGFEKIIVR